MQRREFLEKNLVAAPAVAAGFGLSSLWTNPKQNLDTDGYIPLFDGKTLKGWHREHRIPLPKYLGRSEPDHNSEKYKKALTTKGLWTVEDGAIVGGQNPPGSGLGGYLVSDKKFGDFELLVDVKPDWPVDTGILVRANSLGAPGIQVLIDHRKSGGIGGFYGNGIGGYHALPYAFDVKYDEKGKAIGLIPESPKTSKESVTKAKKNLLAYAAPIKEFLAAWKWEDWNTFKIRCEGEHAYLTTWINGVKICELDTAKIAYPDYDKEEVLKYLGSKGHISFEVHDNGSKLGKGRWWPGAVCRWKNILIKELS